MKEIRDDKGAADAQSRKVWATAEKGFPPAQSKDSRTPASRLLAAAMAVIPAAAAAIDLDPAQVPQFVSPLPNLLDPSFVWKPDGGFGSNYTLNIEQVSQSLGLGAGIPAATIWAYGKAGQAPTLPGRTFEVNRGQPISVKYVNKLTDPRTGRPLPNLMPVDTTLDWANPGAVGGITPVPLVAHLHGGDSQYLSDGLPDAWGTPCARIPCRGATNQSGSLFTAAPYVYENAQEAGTLWYHDHALGITRTNVYMGLSGMYLLRDRNENWLRSRNVLPAYPYEVPLLIQDRLFTTDGQLSYPADPAEYPADDPLPGLPYTTHLPEFFGNVALVNGKAWPKLDVEPRKYRLRLLNGSDSRFYELRFEYFGNNAPATPGTGRAVPVIAIGDELGLLDKPAQLRLDGRPGQTPVPSVLAVGPGERYDLVIDFSRVPGGSRVMVTNTGNEPYPDADPPQPSMNLLAAFDVTKKLDPRIPDASLGAATDLRPLSGKLPKLNTTGIPVRRIMLFEGNDTLGRLQTMLGPVDADPSTGQQGTLIFKDPTTERPRVGTTEIWEFYNTTVDAHPIHMHLVDFRILDRQAFTGTVTEKVNTDGSLGGVLEPASIVKTGAAQKPSAWESGKKDTVKAFPGEVTRVLVSFNRTGEYVYHCHILSHEDHEMMRPFEVVP